MEKAHKILLTAMVIQTLLLSLIVLQIVDSKVKPVIKEEVKTATIVLTPTATPKLAVPSHQGKEASPAAIKSKTIL